MRRLSFHHDEATLAEYALGGLHAGERIEIEQHLGDCRRCADRAASAADAFAILADDIAPIAPAAGLKHRLFGSIAGGR